MRGRSLTDLLRYEATRKPAIAALVERVQTMTDAEIDATPVPLPWFRQALKALRDQQAEQGLFDRVRALIEAHIVEGTVPDPMGEMRRWQGGSTFLALNRGGGIGVDDGCLLWLPDDGGVWIDTIFARVPDPRVAALSQPLGRTTKLGYTQACRARLARLCPVDAPVIGALPDTLARYGVRIG